MIGGPLDRGNRPCMTCEHPECGQVGSDRDWGKGHTCGTKERLMADDDETTDVETIEDSLAEYFKNFKMPMNVEEVVVGESVEYWDLGLAKLIGLTVRVEQEGVIVLSHDLSDKAIALLGVGEGNRGGTGEK